MVAARTHPSHLFVNARVVVTSMRLPFICIAGARVTSAVSIILPPARSSRLCAVPVADHGFSLGTGSTSSWALKSAPACGRKPSTKRHHSLTVAQWLCQTVGMIILHLRAVMATALLPASVMDEQCSNWVAPATSTTRRRLTPRATHSQTTVGVGPMLNNQCRLRWKT